MLRTILLLVVFVCPVFGENLNHAATTGSGSSRMVIPPNLDPEQIELLRLLDLAIRDHKDVPVTSGTYYALVQQYQIEEAIKAFKRVNWGEKVVPFYIDHTPQVRRTHFVIPAEILKETLLRNVTEASKGQRKANIVILEDCSSNLIRETIEVLDKDYSFYARRYELPKVGALKPKYADKITDDRVGSEISRILLNSDPNIINASYDQLSEWLNPGTFQQLLRKLPGNIVETRWQQALQNGEWKQLPGSYLLPLSKQLDREGSKHAAAVNAHLAHETAQPEVQYAMHRLGLDPQDAFSFVDDRSRNLTQMACVLARFKPDQMDAVVAQLDSLIQSGKVAGEPLKSYEALQAVAKLIAKASKKIPPAEITLRNLRAYRKYFAEHEALSEALAPFEIKSVHFETRQKQLEKIQEIKQQAVDAKLARFLIPDTVFPEDIVPMEQDSNFKMLRHFFNLSKMTAYRVLTQDRLNDPEIGPELISQFSLDDLKKISIGELGSEIPGEIKNLAKAIVDFRGAVETVPLTNLRAVAEYNYFRKPYNTLIALAKENVSTNTGLKSNGLRDKVRSEFYSASRGRLEILKDLIATGDQEGAAALIANLGDRDDNGNVVLYLQVPATRKGPGHAFAFNFGKTSKDHISGLDALDASDVASDGLPIGALSQLSIAPPNVRISQYLKPGLRSRKIGPKQKAELVSYRSGSSPLLTPGWLLGSEDGLIATISGGSKTFAPLSRNQAPLLFSSSIVWNSGAKSDWPAPDSSRFPNWWGATGNMPSEISSSGPLESPNGVWRAFNTFEDCYQRWDHEQLVPAFPSQYLNKQTEP